MATGIARFDHVRLFQGDNRKKSQITVVHEPNPISCHGKFTEEHANPSREAMTDNQTVLYSTDYGINRYFRQINKVDDISHKFCFIQIYEEEELE